MMPQVKALARAYWKYAAVAAAVVLVGGYFVFGGKAGTSSYLTIVPGDFATQVAVSGTVIAARDVDLGFASSGRVAGVYASVGQHVYAGQLLASVENGDLQAQLAEKQAQLDALKAGTRPEEVAIAQAAVAAAQSALVDAVRTAYTTADDAVHNKSDVLFTNPRIDPKLSFTVSSALLKTTAEHDRATIEPVLTALASSLSGLSSANAADAAVTTQKSVNQIIAYLADANAALNQAVPDQSTSAATLSTYGTSLAAARSAVNGAATALSGDLSALTNAQSTLALDQAGATASDIAVAEAGVTSARAALVKTQVVAPFSGLVTRMDAKTGEITSPATAQISLQSDGTFEIEVYIPEVSISGVVVGNAATTTLDAYGSSVEFAAKVVSVDPAETVKDGVPTYKTTLIFLKNDPRIRSGMTANVAITTGMLHDAIVIPAGAVITDASGSHVTVIGPDKKPVNRVVTTGPAPALGQAVILSGLASGDVILLTPNP